MRNAMPMQWIEQAEARQVLAAARFEMVSKAPWCSTAAEAAAQWLALARSWVAPGYPIGLPHVQVQPATIRRPAGRSQSLR